MATTRRNANGSAKFEGVQFVFLDRDGVINCKAPGDGYIKTCEELALLPGAAHAIRLLNDSTRKVIVVTNQRGIALGRLSETSLSAIHQKLKSDLGLTGAHVDAIYHCPHDFDSCDCRKPGTGMFRLAFRNFPGACPENGVMIGDSESDILAGKSMGMRTIRINDAIAAEDGASCGATATAKSLLDAVERHLV
jgi:D-glycero-D-manno-heptose 1,7-bisphosphate phosphatase